MFNEGMVEEVITDRREGYVCTEGNKRQMCI